LGHVEGGGKWHTPGGDKKEGTALPARGEKIPESSGRLTGGGWGIWGEKAQKKNLVEISKHNQQQGGSIGGVICDKPTRWGGRNLQKFSGGGELWQTVG